jgi:hypothetical protein
MKTLARCLLLVLVGCFEPRDEIGAPDAGVSPTGKWVAVGTPTTNAHRYNQSATVLRDGRVLAAGGETWDLSSSGVGTSTVNAGAEIFDPASRLWTPTGSLLHARGAHRATLLKDGRVLVTGGESVPFSEWTALDSAELYDPISGTWRMTAPMAKPRLNHAQLLLPDGRVFVAGGSSGSVEQVPPVSTTLATVEVFDPSSETWSSWAPLPQAEPFVAALLMGDGRPLIVGSFEAEVYDPSVGSQPPPPTVHPYQTPPSYAPWEGVPCGGPFELGTGLSDGTAHLLAGQTSFVLEPTRPLDCRSLLGPATALPSPVMSVGLADGLVLFIVGAIDASLLHAQTGAFTALPQRIYPRGTPNVLLLHDGSVLVTGGADVPSELLEWD